MTPRAILASKVGMTDFFAEDGSVIPVTVLLAGPCTVIGTRTPEKDKYAALRLGFAPPLKEKNTTKPFAGVFKKAGVEPKRYVREVRVKPEDLAAVKVGDLVKADIFKKGEFVDVTGITKGRGFQGVFKRHDMVGAKSNSHGTHEHRRHPGSIGQRKTPGRTFPGKRMPGHYGVEQVTIQNLQVADVDVENGILLLRGAVPGAPGGLLAIRESVKGRKPAPVVRVQERIEGKAAKAAAKKQAAPAAAPAAAAAASAKK
jgi:large subunit ribosomal protein L3